MKRVREAIARTELDWLILFHPVSIHWLTGSDAKSYQAFQCLMVSAESRPTVMLTRESERNEFEDDAWIDELETWGGSEPQDPLEVFGDIANKLGLQGKRVGIEVPAYYLHPHHYEKVKLFLGRALVAEPTGLVPHLKLVKSPREIELVRKAGAIADEAMRSFTAALQPGRSELQVAAEVYRTLLAEGSGLPASTMNLVSGKRAGFSHGAPTERILQHGDAGNVEYGAAYKRYTATIGRQFCLGAPSRRVQHLYDVVRAAADACIAEIRDGVPAIVPHEAAKRVIAEAGFDRYRIHTSGYGIAPGFPPSWGEPLNMFGGTTDVLKAGMVISVEPPVFIGSEHLGARIIDNVLVTENGAELLGRFPRELVVA
ncbi:M24 family metallopeptidase [Microvirga calopogonii]|uniref:M24 family metallopeptidase n=1 Tax=Microvirga calopogonii TaxID=2078013 RepID=UPI00197C8DA0|nr:Xaa-Pro peptidase family protein [Microvirga calopogonii]